MVDDVEFMIIDSDHEIRINDPVNDLDGWHIERNVKPIPDRRHDYDFWHDEYDGGNGLAGTAESIDDAMRQISEIENECI